MGEEEQQPKMEEEEPKPIATSTPVTSRLRLNPSATVDPLDKSLYFTALPVLPEEDSPYTPILYTFRVKVKSRNSKLKNIKSRPPPYYLQFDHAIAVIWTLFNKSANKENLGIGQLQWALHFLQSIYTSSGIHPRDVQLCIDVICDYLIEKYAQLSGETVVYGSAKFGDFSPEEKKPPFSANYVQMISKIPPPGPLDGHDSMILDKQLLEELENVKKVVGIDSIDLTKVVSKEQVMDILQDWKKEQIEKIQDELKLLYVVEDMMKNSDSQNFQGYTDEKQFGSILRKNK